MNGEGQNTNVKNEYKKIKRNNNEEDSYTGGKEKKVGKSENELKREANTKVVGKIRVKM